MKSLKKTVFAVFIVFALIQETSAQVLIGSGFAEVSEFTSTALDGGAGFSIQIEKDVNLSESAKIKMHPNISTSFVFSNYDRLGFPLYFNVFTVSPKISYGLFTFGKVKIAPYANPFASFILGIKSDDFNFESETINTSKWGLEGGLMIDLKLEKTVLRFIPVTAQRSLQKGDFYLQAMASLLIEI